MSPGVRATAPGKLMLLGEYAVLEGAPGPLPVHGAVVAPEGA